MPSPLRAVGVYIYAGGFTHGVLRLNDRPSTPSITTSAETRDIDVLCHLEDPKPYGEKTFKLNYPDIPVYPHGKWPVESLKGNVDLIYANPPCKAFSQLGLTVKHGRTAWNDPRLAGALECTHNVANLLFEIEPRMLVWESVMGSLTNASSLIHSLWEKYIKPAGYDLTILPHNAAHHGSVQNRSRVLYVCHRDPLSFVEPNFDFKWTVADRLTQLATAQRQRLETSCYRDEAFELGRIRELMAVQKPGMSLRNAFDELEKVKPEIGQKLNKHGGVEGRPSIGWGIRLRWDALSNVVCKAPFIHPDGQRYCTLEEMTVLADYPHDWKWAPNSGLTAVREMARGVSPAVGNFVGQLARMTLGSRLTSQPVENPDIRFIDLRVPREKRVDLPTFFAKRKTKSPLIDGGVQAELDLTGATCAEGTPQTEVLI